MRRLLTPMAALRAVPVALAFLVASSGAQIVTEEVIVTDSVDLFSEPADYGY